MKFLDHVSTAQSNLRRSLLRTSLTIAAIVIGALTLALSLGLGEGVRNYITSQIGRYEDANLYSVSKAGGPPGGEAFSVEEPAPYDPDADKVITDFSQIFMSQAEVEEVFAINGVGNAYKPYSFAIEYVYGPSQTKYAALGTTTFPEFNKTVLAGNADLEQQDSNGVVISSKYLAALGFKDADDAIGKPVSIAVLNQSDQPTEFIYTIAAVIEPGLFDSAFNFSESGARQLAETEKGTLIESFAEVYVSKTDEVTEEAFKASFATKGYEAQSIKDAIGTLNNLIDALQIGLGVFSGIAILAALVGVINTLFMSVLERTKEIGLLRSLGASKRTIFTMFSFEAILIGFWGSLAGLAIANIATLAINRIAANTFLKGVEGFQLLGLTWELHVGIIASISLISLVAGLLPALKASRLNPIEALKYE